MQEGTAIRIITTTPANRQDDGNHTSNIASPTLVPRPTMPEESSTTDIPVIQGNSSYKPGSIPQAGFQ